ncbi:MAG: ribonuclease Z [Nanoarchaeota archaeon]|nr:ribonuclease Z [Nanoarchaeota archaeon]MBU1030003.1 ribonuclease Z [Nanoarchaeota archaeon]
MELVFLGTSCMVPTKERNVQGIFLSYKNEGILIDCGEGTQRQMNIAGINRNKVTKILISHWHGDHVAGLIGLIQTMGNTDNPSTLEVYGPKGTKEKMNHILNTCDFDLRIDLQIFELDPKSVEVFIDKKDYQIECAYLDHTTPCLGYSFVEKDRRKINLSKIKSLGIPEGPVLGKIQEGKSIVLNGKKISPNDVSRVEKGKKITFILDSVLCENCYSLSENADILISEACYLPDLQEKADFYKHMTTKQAALIASKSGVKKLILTHFSQRYKTVEKLEKDAKDYFEDSICAYDFMKIKL